MSFSMRGALDPSALPSPSTTSATEISFRRLLQSCYQQLQQDETGIRSNPKFHSVRSAASAARGGEAARMHPHAHTRAPILPQYVAKLEELLSDMDASGRSVARRPAAGRAGIAQSSPRP